MHEGWKAKSHPIRLGKRALWSLQLLSHFDLAKDVDNAHNCAATIPKKGKINSPEQDQMQNGAPTTHKSTQLCPGTHTGEEWGLQSWEWVFETQVVLRC